LAFKTLLEIPLPCGFEDLHASLFPSINSPPRHAGEVLFDNDTTAVCSTVIVWLCRCWCHLSAGRAPTEAGLGAGTSGETGIPTGAAALDR